ncbi:MAG: ankyrin repeat domain-containing protein [Wolbachia endosymbiont of Xenopsylla cheopis]
MADDRINVIISQKVKEDYEYVKNIINAPESVTLSMPIRFFFGKNNEDNYSISWNQMLEMLNKHIKQNSPEAPLATERYIDYLMYAACFYNDLDLITWLINNGANVNFQEPESGNTLLHLAALHGNVRLAKLLIAHGADLNYHCYDIKANLQGNTYLHFASEGGYDEFIQFIRNEVASKSVGMESISDIIKYKNKEGNTALHLAAKNGHVKCVDKILGNSSYDSGGGQNILAHLVVSCVATVMYLCSISVFLYHTMIKLIKSKDYIGLSGLCFLVIASLLSLLLINISLFKSFVKDGENSLVGVNNDRKTALHLAIKNIQEESDQDQYYQCAQLLIEAIPNSQINIQDKEGNTALHLAAEKGLERSVEALLKKKANAEIMTNNKETALHLAIKNSHYNCAMCLAQGIQTKKERLRLKLLEFSYIIRNKYDYHIKPYIEDFKEKVQKKTQVKKSWQEEVLCLAIKHQSKASSNHAKWLFKREVVGQLLRMVDESEINEVYSYAKDYSERKDIKDGNCVLKKLNNFFRANEKCRSKNLSKLQNQESWCKDHILHTTSVLSAILALLFILKQNSYLSNSYYFSQFDNFLTILVKVATIFSVYFTIKLYLKHKELDKLTDCQDKIEEINNLLIKKKEADINPHIKAQDSNFYCKPYHNNRCQNSDQLVLHSDAEEACSAQQQRKSSYTFSKSELSECRSRRAASDVHSELTPLLPLSLPIKTYRSFPNKLDKLKQAYQSIKQSFILDIKSIKELKYKKTLNRELIKNPSFNKSTEKETFL